MSRTRAKCVPSVYCRSPKEGSVYAVSPFVTVRKMGWKQTHRVLIANLANERHFQEPASAAPLLSFVNSKPRTEEEMERFWDELHCSRKLLRKTLADLLQNGTLVICEEPRIVEQAPISVSLPRTLLSAPTKRLAER